ncbi:hypothetical protein [Enterococcus pallens]|uniref:Membrane protein 6-pyruvoyl-tetrahydropterin synthase-related domain-containing protein n=1 Tax=Enterococcus pallens ATCC BAA-351 TaxID=1158607 RepID=R2PX57_9ENTE|nr:hypothetical protein [Enterococcus pallens]EOH87773.1 hypothetical protein UAU_04627 [Enterococcus pallens ATCC BAA-351]EOU17987.1 hypothetical protein I588_02975 [Enterococcus pallens ATCC BAA-351]OJG82389.1 hypothetical protein RV10_GL000210 [Enterococcus pallens]
MLTKNGRFIDFFIMLILSAVYILPLFLPGDILHTVDQDTYFHLSRIIGLDNVWESPVNFNNFGHHGTMINVFYPWLTTYPAYLFWKLTGSLVWGYNLYYLVVTFLTMIISYLVMNNIKNKGIISLLFAIVYTFSAYRAIDIFQRASLGEAVSLTFLPIVLLGCYEIYIRNFTKWYWLALGMSLIVYTHLLSVAMVTMIIAITIIVSFYFWDNKLERIISLLKAVLLTLFLTAGFLVPFIQQYLAQELKVPSGRVLVGMQPADMLIQMVNNNLSAYTSGLLILICIVSTIPQLKRLSLVDQFIFFLGVTILFCSTALFPWSLFTNTVFAKIQFVWRLNAFTTLFVSYAASIGIYKGFLKKNKRKIVLVFLSIIFIHGSGIINLYTLNKENISRISSQNIITKVGNYEHTDYANRESIKHQEFVVKNKYMLGGREVVPKVSYNSNTFTIEVQNASNVSKDLITPLYKYHGQKVKINKKEASSKLSAMGTTELIIPPGDSTITISYKYTNVAIISTFISLSTLFLLSIFGLIKRWRNHT